MEPLIKVSIDYDDPEQMVIGEPYATREVHEIPVALYERWQKLKKELADVELAIEKNHTPWGKD